MSDQILAIRNLLKEINTVKEELEKVNQCSVSHIKAEEARRQRLEQRNDALADEFRRLKPEIAEAYRLLNKLIEGIGAYAGTMINLHDLLKASFPIRFSENDRQALLEEINAIADNAISHIRGEREKADVSGCLIVTDVYWFVIYVSFLISFAGRACAKPPAHNDA